MSHPEVITVKLSEENILQTESATETTNILLLGIAGSGKSAIVNALVKKSGEEVGEGVSVTKCFTQYTSTIKISNKLKKLVVFDSKGLGYSNQDICSELKNFISINNSSSDSNDHIHLIWIIISAETDRTNFGVYNDLEKICNEFNLQPLYAITKVDLFLNRKRREELDPFFSSLKNVFYLALNASGYPQYCPTCESKIISIKGSNYLSCNAKSHKINNVQEWWSQNFGLDKIMDKSLTMLPEAQKNAFLSSQLFCLDTKKLLGLQEIRSHCKIFFPDQNTIIKHLEIRLNQIWGIETTVNIDEIIGNILRYSISSPFIAIFPGDGSQTITNAFVGLYINNLLYNMAQDMMEKYNKGSESLIATENDCKPDNFILWTELLQFISLYLEPKEFIDDPSKERPELNIPESPKFHNIRLLKFKLENFSYAKVLSVIGRPLGNAFAINLPQKRVLCIEGGEIKGKLIPEILGALETFEELTGKKIYKLFDVICGSGAGRLLSLFLGLLKFSISEAREQYSKLDSGNNYEMILRNIFGEKKFSDCIAGPDTPYVFFFRNTYLSSPLFANYSRPDNNTFNSFSLNFPLWEAAAIVYFGPHKLSYRYYRNDIGIIGNNTSFLLEVNEMFGREEKHVVLSIGSEENFGGLQPSVRYFINASEEDRPEKKQEKINIIIEELGMEDTEKKEEMEDNIIEEDDGKKERDFEVMETFIAENVGDNLADNERKTLLCRCFLETLYRYSILSNLLFPEVDQDDKEIQKILETINSLEKTIVMQSQSFISTIQLLKKIYKTLLTLRRDKMKFDDQKLDNDAIKKFYIVDKKDINGNSLEFTWDNNKLNRDEIDCLDKINIALSTFSNENETNSKEFSLYLSQLMLKKEFFVNDIISGTRISNDMKYSLVDNCFSKYFLFVLFFVNDLQFRFNSPIDLKSYFFSEIRFNGDLLDDFDLHSILEGGSNF